jgi:phosphate:Na+ symporter
VLNSIVANIIAGLGLFFSGLKMLDTNLRQATGRQLRMIIGHLTRTRWVSGLVGVAAGGLVPSSSGILFILVSLTTSGLTTVERALPIITWANVGCCALIFAAVIDLRLAILYLIGVAGAAFAFDRSRKNMALGAVFGVGMLFYGIELMKSGIEPVKELPWFSELLVGNRSYLLAFISGTAFSFVTQSSTAISILVIGFAQTALIGPFQAMIALYGANVGSTFARKVLSSTLTGAVRQLAAFQDLFKITGAVLFAFLLYLEAFHGVPLVHALVAHLSNRIDRQMALVFLLFNLVPATLFSIFQSSILRVLEGWFPDDSKDELSRPHFLYDEALDEPSTALDLIEKEKLRLIKAFSMYPQAMRAGAKSTDQGNARRLHEPFTDLAARIERFQHELMNFQLGSAEMERLTRLQGRLSLIVYIEDSLRTLHASTLTIPRSGSLADLLSTFIEGLDFVLLTAIDALETKDPTAIDLLFEVTSDRGDLVERMRNDFLSGSGASSSDRAVLLQVTSVFERIVWMMHRLARLMDTGQPHVEAYLSATS